MSEETKISITALQAIEEIHNGLVAILLETEFPQGVEDRLLPLVEQLGEIMEQNFRD